MAKQGEAYTPSPAEGKPRRVERRRAAREERAEAKHLTEESLHALVHLGVETYMLEVGLQGIERAMEIETTALCGPKGRHDPMREAVRYGHTDTSVRVLGGRRTIVRPRVRKADGSGEVALEVLSALRQDDEGMRRAVMGATLRGVSQRGYVAVAEALTGGHGAPGRTVFGQSRQSVNRTFVAATGEVARELQSRPLTGGAYRVVFIDGIHFAKHLVVAAVGIRDDGTKEVLGLEPGTTENHVVCTALLEGLIARGLPAEVARLVVVDGGPGILKAVEHVFGPYGVVQRCQAHKWRNVAGHLPKDAHLQAGVKRELVTAWRLSDETRGEQRLLALSHRLEDEGHTAAAHSLREGLKQTLSVARLGLEGSLRRALTTTNAMESSFSTVGRMGRRVTHWQHGAQVVRWVATGLSLAQRSYRQQLTARQMDELAKALDRAIGKNLPSFSAA